MDFAATAATATAAAPTLLTAVNGTIVNSQWPKFFWNACLGAIFYNPALMVIAASLLLLLLLLLLFLWPLLLLLLLLSLLSLLLLLMVG